LTGRDREQVALSIMYLVGRDYSAGKSSWSAHALAAELDIPSIALAPVLHCLEQNGLLLATEGEAFVPGRDIGAIRLAEIFEVVRALHSGRLAIAIHSVGPAVALLNEVEASMEEPLKSRTLKDFIETKF
jgi:membrane protein